MKNLRPIFAPLITLILGSGVLLWLRRDKNASDEADTARTALLIERAKAWLPAALPAAEEDDPGEEAETAAE